MSALLSLEFSLYSVARKNTPSPPTKNTRFYLAPIFKEYFQTVLNCKSIFFRKVEQQHSWISLISTLLSKLLVLEGLIEQKQFKQADNKSETEARLAQQMLRALVMKNYHINLQL